VNSICFSLKRILFCPVESRFSPGTFNNNLLN
jgi:hypothetical protein